MLAFLPYLLGLFAFCGLCGFVWFAFFDRPASRQPYGINSSRFSLFRPRQKTGLPKFDKATNQAPNDLQAHASLVRLCGGDVSKVERLIAFEQRKGKPRAQATRDALDRLLYDRQR